MYAGMCDYFSTMYHVFRVRGNKIAIKNQLCNAQIAISLLEIKDILCSAQLFCV